MIECAHAKGVISSFSRGLIVHGTAKHLIAQSRSHCHGSASSSPSWSSVMAPRPPAAPAANCVAAADGVQSVGLPDRGRGGLPLPPVDVAAAAECEPLSPLAASASAPTLAELPLAARTRGRTAPAAAADAEFKPMPAADEEPAAEAKAETGAEALDISTDAARRRRGDTLAPCPCPPTPVVDTRPAVAPALVPATPVASELALLRAPSASSVDTAAPIEDSSVNPPSIARAEDASLVSRPS